MTSICDAWVASPRGKDTKHGYIQGSLCPGTASKMGFFLQNVCMRKAPFKGYKNDFGGGWGAGGCWTLFFSLRPAKSCLFPGTFLALLGLRVQGGL